MSEKIEHSHKCQKCGKPATWNLQNNWHLWKITSEGEFIHWEEWTAGENDFLCDECYREEVGIKKVEEME